MSGHRQRVQEYIQVSEAFLEMDELSNAEIAMVQEMLFRIIEKLHKSRNHGDS